MELTFYGVVSVVDSPQDAAKAADLLMYLKEGIMAWTNFSLTDIDSGEVKKLLLHLTAIDYVPDIQYDEIKKLPQDWIPLQDNPRKYLTNDK